MLLKNLKQKHVRRIIGSSATHSAYTKAVKDYIQLVMLNLALIIPIFSQAGPRQKSGLIIGILYFFIFLATSLASKLSSIVAAKSPGNIAFITLLLGFTAGTISGIFYHYSFWIVSLLAFAGIYLLENIRKPVLTGAIAMEVPTEILSSVISAQSQLRTILTILLALIFGIIADHSGVGTSLMVVSGLLLLVTGIIELSAKKTS